MHLIWLVFQLGLSLFVRTLDFLCFMQNLQSIFSVDGNKKKKLFSLSKKIWVKEIFSMKVNIKCSFQHLEKISTTPPPPPGVKRFLTDHRQIINQTQTWQKKFHSTFNP